MDKRINRHERINTLKTLLSAVLIITVLLAVFDKPSAKVNNLPPQVNITDDEFMIGAMDAGTDQNYQYIPQLNMNAWHKYTGAVPSDWYEGVRGWPGVSNDWYFEPTSNYGEQIAGRISTNRNYHGYRSIMDRPKIQYLAMGQRSDYKCAELTGHYDGDYWFYTYANHNVNVSRDWQDNTQFGNGTWVRYCRINNSTNQGDWTNSAGDVMTDLKANHEQANKMWNYWQNDDTYKWYVMPRIRIDPSVVINFPETPVCTVEVRDWNNTVIKQQVILAKYFAPNGYPNQYSGQYLEEYYFNQTINETPSAIDVSAGDICPPPDKNFLNWYNSDIQTDFRVYWYGYCDMWIDYVRVENEPAHQLFKNINNWDQQIREEVDLALTSKDNTGYVPNIFYIEEFEFNCLPCIGKVNQIIKDYAYQQGVDLSLMVNLNYALFKVHEPNCWNLDMTSAQLKKYLVDSGGVKTIVFGTYPLRGWEGNEMGWQGLGDNTWPPAKSKHPVTLSDKIYDRTQGILSDPAPPAEYDTWLQGQIDNGDDEAGGFMKVMKLADGITKISPDTRLVNLHQDHLWWSSGAKLKEPSNEEMNLLANLPITYGAKGLLTFWYGSYGEYNVEEDKFYGRGLTGGFSPNGSPRTENVYGQNKWQAMGIINNRFKVWGPTLMSFDNANRHSYIYHNEAERTELTNPAKSYFKRVITYRPGTLQPSCPLTPGFDSPPNIIYDCQEYTYVQVATFKASSIGTENANYFMIVNRRCSPFVNDNNDENHGGKRKICLVFHANHPAFEGPNSWDIIDLGNPTAQHIQFDKTIEQLIDLGQDFDPGEGRLYKIVPTAQIGGNLFCDENISNEEFTCLDTVYNNGHNITIGSGTTIHFTDSSKFIMNGGTFQLGGPNYNGPCNISIGAASGNRWTGFDFNNCTVKV